jgi:hypothetical protein
MDDIEVPRTGAAYHSYDRPATYDHDRRPAPYHPDRLKAPEKPAEGGADATYVARNAEATGSTAPATDKPARLKKIALKSENVYTVTKYRVSGGSLSYVLASGGTGSVDVTDVDWRTTSRLNAEPSAPSAVAENYQRP